MSRPRPSRSRGRGPAPGFTRLIVEPVVFSALAFSLALFVAATMQACYIVREAFSHPGEAGTTKQLLIGAGEQADTLLVGVALLIVSLGLQAPFVGGLRNVPAWLCVRTFSDLKQKLLGIVVTALAVNSPVALEWEGGPRLPSHGATIAAVIVAVGAYSPVPAHGEADADARP